MAAKTLRRTPTLSPKTFLPRVSQGRSVAPYRRKQVIFAQGDPADAVLYVQKGRVKLAVVSKQGKEAVVALLGADEFFGEGCLAGQPLRMSTATAIEDTAVLRVRKKVMVRLLHTDQRFAELFTTHLLSRNIRFEEDLVDQLFNSSEKRLARVLLLLAHFGKDGKKEPVIPKISQETLAGMIGTTRSRVSHFMNKSRKLGFIDYNGGLLVHSSLFNIVLYD
jgi:CRP/FNR family cyclic AMP-dependent transcriptional regulator